MGIKRIVESIIGQQINDDQPFMESGLDSLGAMELRNSIADTFGINNLPGTLVFDYPTINALLAYLQSSTPVPRQEASTYILKNVEGNVKREVSDLWQSRSSIVVAESCRYPSSNSGIGYSSHLSIPTLA